MEIGNYAFTRNKLTNVVIPKSVTKLGWEAFADNNLTDVTIYNAQLEFVGDAFRGNQKNLTIHGYSSSTTEAFANEFGYAFNALEEPNELTEIINLKSQHLLF